MQPDRLYCHPHMPVQVEPREVLIRLGDYRDHDAASIKRAEEVLRPLLPGGCMRLLPLEVHDDGILLQDREMKSKSLAAYLKGCGMALVMLSTLYHEVSEAIGRAFSENRADEAVLLDAAASEAADAGLDYLMRDAARMLRPFGKTLLKRRFSPGYGDCPIQYQKTLLELLHDQPLGVTLTESCMLLPEKSVLAIGGVRHA